MKMFGMPISNYGDASVFQYRDDLEIPEVNPNEVLIEIRSTSVNPIDLMKREGYGKTVFEKQRRNLFPWILGSDISGVVKDLGSRVKNFSIGDEVWGSTSNPKGGTYSQFSSINQFEIDLKPTNLSFNEAASLPYVGLTTWAALIRWASLRPQDLNNKKVFINAGSGGVGTFAIQFLKSWGAKIATTCSKENHDLVRSLGADLVIDYKAEKFCDKLFDYDLVYDCVGDFAGQQSVSECIGILKNKSSSHYISLNHPFVRTIDKKGLIVGIPTALKQRHEAKKKAKPVNLHWSIYRPSTSGLKEIRRMVESNTVKPIIDSIYPLKQLKEAHERVATSHAQGKVVVEVIKHD